MTDAIHAVDSAQIGEPGCATNTYLDRSIRPFIRDPFAQFAEARGDKAGAQDPLAGSPAYDFLTGSGGFAQVFTYGLTGLRWRADRVHLDPMLPPQLAGGVTLRGLHWRGRTFDVEIGATHHDRDAAPRRAFTLETPRGTHHRELGSADASRRAARTSRRRTTSRAAGPPRRPPRRPACTPRRPSTAARRRSGRRRTRTASLTVDLGLAPPRLQRRRAVDGHAADVEQHRRVDRRHDVVAAAARRRDRHAAQPGLGPLRPRHDDARSRGFADGDPGGERHRVEVKTAPQRVGREADSSSTHPSAALGRYAAMQRLLPSFRHPPGAVRRCRPCRCDRVGRCVGSVRGPPATSPTLCQNRSPVRPTTLRDHIRRDLAIAPLASGATVSTVPSIVGTSCGTDRWTSCGGSSFHYDWQITNEDVSTGSFSGISSSGGVSQGSLTGTLTGRQSTSPTAHAPTTTSGIRYTRWRRQPRPQTRHPLLGPALSTARRRT